MNLYERVWIVDYIKCSLMLIMMYGLFYEVSVKYMNCKKSLFDLGYHIRDRNKKKDQKGLFAVCHAVRAHGKADVHVVCRHPTFFLPCVKVSTRRSICRMPVERLTAKTLFAGR